MPLVGEPGHTISDQRGERVHRQALSRELAHGRRVLDLGGERGWHVQPETVAFPCSDGYVGARSVRYGISPGGRSAGYISAHGRAANRREPV